MSTISLAVPVQPPMISAPSLASSSAVTDDGTNDKKSFADCLKETKDDSDKENQTASTTSRPHTSPKRAASEKEPHRKTSGEASGPLAIGDIPQTQVLDPRSLMLSWKKSGAEGGGRGRVGSATAAAAQADSAANPASSSAQKGQIAFGVSIPQNVVKAQQPPAPPAPPANANPNAVTNLAAQNAQANTEGDSARGGHSNSNGGNNSSDSSASGASVTAASTQTKEADVTAIAAPTAASANLNSTIVHAVPAAYTQVDSMKSSAPVAASAPVTAIDEPPAAPTLRPHSIEIQVPGTEGQQVDVRVSQRAGNVDVTVRTPDNEIAQSLRQHLPELSERLSQSGVNGDVWQPAAASAETSNGNGSTSGNSQDQNWQGQQQNQQQQARQESDSQQNRRGSNWINEFYTEQEGR